MTRQEIYLQNAKEVLGEARAFVENYKTPEDLEVFDDIASKTGPTEALSLMRKGRLLTCAPRISRDGRSIVYAFDKYITRRNGMFVIASREDGQGLLYIPTIPTEKMKNYQEREALGLISTALTYYDKTLNAMVKTPEVFDKYLEPWGVCIDDIMEHIGRRHLSYIPLYDTDSLLLVDDTKEGFAVLQFEHARISLFYKEHHHTWTEVVFWLPDWFYESEDKSDALIAYTELLLKYAAIKTNYNLLYPITTKYAAKYHFQLNVWKRATTWKEVIEHVEKNWEKWYVQ